MESLAPAILKKERVATPDLDRAWITASPLWQKMKSSVGRLPDGFKDIYGIALLTYTSANFKFHKSVNQAVENYGQDPKSFNLYSLHFYLTRAMTLLQPGCHGKPLIVYGINDQRVQPSNPQATERLKYLTITSSIKEVTEGFGKVSLFINTCFGVELENVSLSPIYKKVLIPVNEVFQVTSYNKEENEIALQTTNKKCSYYNCAYLGGKKNENCTEILEIPRSSAPTIMKFSEAVTAPLLVAMSIAVTLTTRS